VKLVRGNKTLDISKNDLRELIKDYEKVAVDVGTGDGRYVFKNALNNPGTFYIGIEPSRKQIEIYSKKTIRAKTPNVLFILSSLEGIQDELDNIATEITINLPWGTLLQVIAKPEQTQIQTLAKILKSDGILEIIFGYTQETEPSEVTRLGLGTLDLTFIRNNVVPVFETEGLSLSEARLVQKDELKNFESTWSKKLSFGKDRPVFYLRFIKH